MKIDFVKTNPTQNMTILVKSPVKQLDYASVAAEIMAYSGVYAEQVGFIVSPSTCMPADARLEMMGGEFCGNAAMSLSAYLAFSKQLPAGSHPNYKLEVSGADKILDCSVLVHDGFYVCRIEMPRVQKIESINTFYKKGISTHKVSFSGITHYVIKLNSDRDIDHTSAELFIEKISLTESGADAVGLIFFNTKTNHITPLVYVLSTKTKIWERGCGSGSCAVGALSAFLKNEAVEIELAQPGGIIKVYASPSGHVEIEGQVKIVAEGTAYI